ncbi:MAG: peptide deformylase [Candidatus Tectomicrobia bacterium]|uniref:Peptide deformylase n=1 Tax=Tectimicrobiota bacterium TaxID=2528274 RepID=A0A932MMT8_UNCTE|nr:peptide deformylase [Candidatus Tectomicrobia bacterium]
MAILKVSRLGHPVLRQAARAVTAEELKSPDFLQLIESMVETMGEYGGVGLAAPQVHFALRLFVMQPNPEEESTLRVAVNPKITPLGQETEEEWEGCLSIPDLHGRVLRFRRLRLEALDARGKRYEEELEGFPARVCQHEYDHLDGVVFLDRMKDFATLTFGEEYRRYWSVPPERKGE